MAPQPTTVRTRGGLLRCPCGSVSFHAEGDVLRCAEDGKRFRAPGRASK